MYNVEIVPVAQNSTVMDRNIYRRKLIILVKNNPMLWNKTLEEFSNRTAKIRKWAQISKVLGVSTDRIRRTWENLRDQYRRDLKRHLLYGIHSKWRFYNHMSFIRGMVRFKETSGYNSDLESADEDLAYNASNVKHLNDNNETSKSPKPVKQMNVVNSSTTELAAANSDLTNEIQTLEPSHAPQQTIHVSFSSQQPQQQKNNYDAWHEQETEQIIPDLVKMEMPSPPRSPIATLVPFDSTKASNRTTSEAWLSSVTSASPPNEGTICRTSQTLSTNLDNQHQLPQADKSTCYTTDANSCNQIEDDDYHFVMSILPALRDIRRQRKLPLRINIMNLISQEFNNEDN